MTYTNAMRLLLAILLSSFSTSLFAAENARPRPDKEEQNPTFVYVGTYTGPASKGIYLFRLKTQGLEVSQNITLVPLGLAAESPNPSFLELDVKRRLVFAANEIEEFEGKPTGAVSAFKVEADGRLTLLSQRASAGTGPCHLMLDRTGRHLFVANYGSGSIAVLPVAADGRLGDATSVIQHKGKSVNPDRQQGPHAHGLAVSVDNRFVLASDLGLDKVLVYRFDADKGTLTPHEPAFVASKPGAGPRHVTFRPDGRFAYVANELDSTVTALAFDAAAGTLKEIQTLRTVPEHFEGANYPAEIDVHPSGKYLYVSNRGHNSIVLFTIDEAAGTLTYVEEQGTGGQKPRHFGIEPSARHMAIANQGSDTVLASRIDAGNGRLKPSGVFATVSAPACVKFLPPAGE